MSSSSLCLISCIFVIISNAKLVTQIFCKQKLIMGIHLNVNGGMQHLSIKNDLQVHPSMEFKLSPVINSGDMVWLLKVFLSQNRGTRSGFLKSFFLNLAAVATFLNKSPPMIVISAPVYIRWEHPALGCSHIEAYYFCHLLSQYLLYLQNHSIVNPDCSPY